MFPLFPIAKKRMVHNTAPATRQILLLMKSLLERKKEVTVKLLEKSDDQELLKELQEVNIKLNELASHYSWFKKLINE